jgi:hypothetical protein
VNSPNCFTAPGPKCQKWAWPGWRLEPRVFEDKYLRYCTLLAKPEIEILAVESVPVLYCYFRLTRPEYEYEVVRRAYSTHPYILCRSLDNGHMSEVIQIMLVVHGSRFPIDKPSRLKLKFVP